MKFKKTKIDGAFLIRLERICDDRGFFARSFCQNEFRQVNINMNIVQCNISYNIKKGTIRGIHYQDPPFEEEKIVTCQKGSIFDVFIDLRKKSPTYLNWDAIELNSNSHDMIYIPRGCAHGFQTLEDNVIVFYQMGEFYNPSYSRGIRWDDPLFGIEWPFEVSVISEKDKCYPDFKK